MTDQVDQTKESPDATQEPQPTGREAQEAGEPTAARADRADAGAAGEGPDELVGTRQERREPRKSAHWRERAKTAEERLGRYQRRDVERALESHVSDPRAALQLSGAELTDLLDEDGEPDLEAVADLAERMKEQYPSLRRTQVYRADIGPKREPAQSSRASWGRLLGGDRR